MRVKHDAFISYSHIADTRLARALEDGLEKLAKPLFALRALDVFRDETSLSANPDLWSGIESHLAGAEWFILLACPESSASAWCRREVRWWVENRPINRMLIVVTGGELAWSPAASDFDWERSSALTDELRGRFSAEPLYVDLRWARGADNLSSTHIRFREPSLSLAATIRGVRKDELDGEDVRQLRRTRRLAAAGLVTVSIAAVVATWQAIEATRQRDVATKATIEVTRQRDVATKATAVATKATIEVTRQRDVANMATKEAIEARDDAKRQANRADDEAVNARRAQARAEDQRATAVALLAQEAIRRGDATTGMLGALAVLPRSGERPWSVDAEAALLQGYLSNREEATLIGHTGIVWWVAYTPDGRHLLSRSEDGSIRIWDLRRSPVTSTLLEGGQSGISLASMSADGRRLAAATRSGKLLLWRLESPDVAPVVLEGHVGKVISLDFSSDGSRLLSGADDKTARIWQLQGPTPSSVVLGGHDSPVNAVRFNPNGRGWVTVAEGALRYWSDDANVPVARVLADLGARIDTVEFSPDGSAVATGARDKRLALWNLGTTSPVVTLLDGHADWVWNVSFDKGGRRLASTGRDGTTRIWNLNVRPRISEVVERYSNFVFRPLFSPDGASLLLASGPTSISLWGVGQNPLARIFAFAAEDGIASAAFSPDGTQLAIGTGDGSIRLLRATRDTPALTALRANSGAAMDAAWSPDGKAFVVFHRNSPDLQLWRNDAGTWRRSLLSGHKAGVNHALFSPDGAWIASASRDTTARLWSATAPSRSTVLSGHTYGVNWVAFSRDGKRVATASQDSTARVWSMNGDAAHPIVLKGHSDVVFFVAFTPSGQLVTASRDRTARLWTPGAAHDQGLSLRLDARKPKAQWSSDHHRAALSTDGRRIALTFDDPTVELWDLHATPPSLVELTGARDLVSDLAFSANGKLVAAATGGSVLVWNVEAPGTRPLELSGSRLPPDKVEFAADGRRLVTASRDGTVRVWYRGRDGSAPSAVITGFGDLDTFARLSPSQDRLVAGTASEDSLLLIDVPSGAQLVANAKAGLTRCLTGAQQRAFGVEVGAASNMRERYVVKPPPC